MVIYLLKSTACLALFIAFYKVFLEQEQMHIFKRYYLLAIILVSFTIPAIVFTEYIEIQEPTTSGLNYSAPVVMDESPTITSPSKEIDWSQILWGIYVLGVFIFTIKFIKNLIQISQRIRKNQKIKTGSNIKVLLEKSVVPHTFFQYIFLHKKKYLKSDIPKPVLLHEETHARQKHSIDVLLIEALQTIFWFNPLMYVLKHSIKLNHEFLADQAVIKEGTHPSEYQKTILSYSSIHQPSLANAINYSSIKKRFTVMKKQTSKKSIILRSFFLIPLTSLLLFGFSEKNKIQIQKSQFLGSDLQLQETIIDSMKKDLKNINFLELNYLDTLKSVNSHSDLKNYNTLAKKYNAIPIEKRIILLKDLRVLETIYGRMTQGQKRNAQPFPECLPKNKQQGASSEQLETYNALAKKYNTMDPSHMYIKKHEIDLLTEIYSIMTNKQKADAQPFPNLPELPPLPSVPEAPEVPVIQKTHVKSTLNYRAQPASPTGPKTLNTSAYADKQLNKIIEEQDPYDVVGGSLGLNQTPLPEPPIPPTYVNDIEFNSLPNPPAPPEPLDYIIEMAKKGATFMYEGEPISSDKAIDLLKNNKELNIESRNKNGIQLIRITKDPVKID